MPRSWRVRVDSGVGTGVETEPANPSPGTAGLQMRMLGPLTVCRGGNALELPRSRKVRALLAYLALAPREVSRSSLCELLWDAPNDPRGELRWCLSRVRSVLDEPERSRVETSGDAIALDLHDCHVDVLDIARALHSGVTRLELAELRRVGQLFGAEFLEGLEIDNSPLFNQWVAAERRRWRTSHTAVLAELIRRLPAESDEVLTHMERWLQIDPFERTAHELLLRALVHRGRLREAEEHLAATIRLFEVEGLEWISVREAWRAAKNEQRTVRIEAKPITSAIAPVEAMPAKRASICVMPFTEQTADGVTRSSLGDGLADDIVTRLAKLRMLFVIARGTAFSLSDRNTDPEEAARILGVDYIASGSVRRRDGRIVVRVELAQALGWRIVWADELDCPQDDTLRSLDEIGNGIVASIVGEVEMAERNRSMLKAPNSLDAWEAYHRGLWHMYRFNNTDNVQAKHFFSQSARLDPTFARAHAGLSFVHFQNAFLLQPAQRASHVALAFETAGQSLMADDRDPAAHCAMGRALWLRGDEAESLTELETSMDLSPNFALAHYTLGFVHCQSGDAQIALDAVDHSRRLSPFDPIMFAMLATRAIAHVRLGEYSEAATWALKAAARPNAHTHILAIAAHCLAVAGRNAEATAFAAKIRARVPHYGVEDFLSSFRFTPDAQTLFRRAAHDMGFA